jgi:hypothetical protein
MFDFFRKKAADGNKVEKLPGPRPIPDEVGRFLVVDLKQDPNWVWTLRAVVKPTAERGGFEVRVFDERNAGVRALKIRDYHAFDTHPDLVLFSGTYNKKTHAAQVAARPAQKAA